MRIFPLGFLPLLLSVADESADVAFDPRGDLLIAAGEDRFFRLFRDDGSLEETDLSGDPDCAGAAFRSLVAAGREIYLGAADGLLFVFDSEGDCRLVADLGEAITGLAVAPGRFARRKGTLIAAAGAGGVLAVDPDADGGATVEGLTPASPDLYVDVTFFGSLLLALDRSNGRVVSVDPDRDPVVVTFASGLDDPVGLVAGRRNPDVIVADAGAGALRSAPVTGDGDFEDLAPYDFSGQAPSGLALDGTGTLAFATRGSVAVRAVRVPAVSPANFGGFVEGPSVGYGDLEFDADGSLLLVANDEGSPPGELPVRAPSNFVIGISRNGLKEQRLAEGVGAEGERLLGLARDPWTGDLYLGSDLGNVWRLDRRGRATLFDSLGSAVLGLEFAPPASELAGRLVASTESGELIALDVEGAAAIPVASLGGRLPDLVFASDGTLYALDAREGAPAVWRRPDGGVFAVLASLAGQGQPDGIEIDEGGGRLLVASGRSQGPDQLLEVTTGGAVRALVDVDIDDGFFPSGVIQDGLGRVLVRSSDTGTAIDVFLLPFPL